jgi:sialate O-acetylesterase
MLLTSPALAQVTDTGRYGPLLEFHPLYQSRMVLQQNAQILLSGSAASGAAVRVATSWGVNASTVADKDNFWIMDISTPKAGKGDFANHQLMVESNGVQLTLDSVQIGEVWLCSGQSNMEMTMDARLPWHEGVLNREKEIAEAYHPNIRVLTIKREGLPYLRQNFTGIWQSLNPEVAANTSGVGYYFARRLQEQLQVPVGIVVAAHGGAACQAFIPKESLQNDSILFNRYLKNFVYDPQEKNPEYRPTLIFQAMINPLKDLAFKGVLWYQGESNANDTMLYPLLQETLISSWKAHFRKNEMPFYYVQMTPYNWKKKDPAANHYALFREAQEKTLLLPQTGMVCTMDVGEPDNIHPRNKKPVGERLAALALQGTYGNNNIEHSGPRMQSVQFEGNEAMVLFNRNGKGSGLGTSDGAMPKHFYVSGEDRRFYPAKAIIKGRTIRLSSSAVSKPVAVRYAFTNDAVTNFQNNAGWPAFPFRTDRWPQAAYATP